MLDGTQNDCGTFIYYPIEEVQAKLYPRHREITADESPADVSLRCITHMIFEAGFDYSFVDIAEIIQAAVLPSKRWKAPDLRQRR